MIFRPANIHRKILFLVKVYRKDMMQTTVESCSLYVDFPDEFSREYYKLYYCLK